MSCRGSEIRSSVARPLRQGSALFTFTAGLRSLLSVDDIVKGLREYLVGAKEWDRTYWIFTSVR